jgi:hypothetical protein
MVPALVLGVAVTLVAAAQAQTGQFPSRKAGLWEMKTTGGPLGGTQQMQQCIDARTDDLLRQQSADQGQNCDKPRVDKRGDSYESELVCRREGVTTTMRGHYAMKGDTAYSGTMRMRFEPPMNGVSEMNMTQEGRWLGPCKSGMKPGDMVMEGVPRTNLLNREGAAPSGLSAEKLKALREDMERRMRESSAK